MARTSSPKRTPPMLATACASGRAAVMVAPAVSPSPTARCGREPAARFVIVGDVGENVRPRRADRLDPRRIILVRLLKNAHRVFLVRFDASDAPDRPKSAWMALNMLNGGTL